MDDSGGGGWLETSDAGEGLTPYRSMRDAWGVWFKSGRNAAAGEVRRSPSPAALPWTPAIGPGCSLIASPMCMLRGSPGRGGHALCVGTQF